MLRYLCIVAPVSGSFHRPLRSGAYAFPVVDKISMQTRPKGTVATVDFCFFLGLLLSGGSGLLPRSDPLIPLRSPAFAPFFFFVWHMQPPRKRLATPRQTNRLRYFCLPVRYRVTRANVHESGRKKRAYSLPTAALVSSPCLGEHWIRKFITRGLPLWVLYARYHTAVISEKSRHYADGPTDGTTTTTTPNFLHLAP